MLILAVTTVNIVINSGLFKHAQGAATMWEQAQQNEKNISINNLISNGEGTTDSETGDTPGEEGSAGGASWIKLTPGKTSIKVTVLQTTAELVGTPQYRFSKDNGETWTEYQTETTYTFTELYGDLAGETYTITAQRKDEAGTIAQTSAEATTTCLNTEYYKNTVGEKICTIGGRDYHIASDLGAIYAIHYHDSGFNAPVVVSPYSGGVSIAAAWFTGSEPNGTIDYHGTTYYWCAPYGMSSTDITTDLVYLNFYNNQSSLYESSETAAQELLDLYFSDEDSSWFKLTAAKTSIEVEIFPTTGEISGTPEYRFSKDNGKTWTEYQTGMSYTFNELYGDLAGITYRIIVEMRDSEGNTKKSAQIATTTCLNTEYCRNTAGELLCTIGGRPYTKVNNLSAACVVLYFTPDWCGPLLVSHSDGWMCSNPTVGVSGLTGTLEYHGTTYYYSIGSAMHSTSVSSTIPYLNTPDNRYSDTAQSVLDLLNLYFAE